MELVAVVLLNLNVLLEKGLPVVGHLPLNDVSGREVGLTIFARDCHFLLRVLQVAIFSIESKLKAVLSLGRNPRSDRFHILVEVRLDLSVSHSHCVEAVRCEN